MNSIVIKISGEYFRSKENALTESQALIFSKALKLISKNFNRIYIIVCGGNFIRGRNSKNTVVPRFIYDEMGMNATNINAQWLSWYLKETGHSSIAVTTGINMFLRNQSQFFTSEDDKSSMNEPKVVVIGGGTTMPYLSTDTLTIITTLRTNSTVALFAKHGVDGVYTADPKIDKSAKFVLKSTFESIVKKQLNFIDLTAAQIAWEAQKRNEKRIQLKVFKFEDKDDLKNVLVNKLRFTEIN